MEERRVCWNCGAELNARNHLRACSFYWLADVVTTCIDEFTFEWEERWVEESVKGKDRCQGWGCDRCLVEFQGRWFHQQCPKIPKRQLTI